MKPRRLLLPACFATITGLGVAVPGVAQPSPTTTTTLPGPRVTICHLSADEGAPKTKTIRVSREALQAHLAHGDDLGACGS